MFFWKLFLKNCGTEKYDLAVFLNTFLTFFYQKLEPLLIDNDGLIVCHKQKYQRANKETGFFLIK